MLTFQYQTSVISSYHQSCLFGEMKLVFADGSSRPLETGSNGNEKWGDMFPLYVFDDQTYPMPTKVLMKWVSTVETKCWLLSQPLDQAQLELLWQQKDIRDNPLFDFFAFGLAPYGKVALWLYGPMKQVLVGWFSAEDISSQMEELPYLFGFSLEDFCRNSLENDKNTRLDLEQYGLPDEKLYDRMMQQFAYRFLPVLKKWDKDNEVWVEYNEDEIQPELDFIEVKCHDGTFDRLRDGSLLNYHEAGKPSRVCVGWHVGKREYSAYFFFSHDELAQVFRTCYGTHPDTKVDFLLMIDPECDKYETALFRYGMNEPLPIGPEACQVLAFRNKFECYRSPNYTQPKGAWR